MNCEICGKDPDLVMLLPIHQANGKLLTMACEECGIKSDAYCKTHQQIHQGYIDGSTACVLCIEEMVCSNLEIANEVRSRLLETLPKSEYLELLEEARVSSIITKGSKEKAILRFLASKAMRTKVTIRDVLYEVISERSVRNLLWF